jgi:hypothetical protein
MNREENKTFEANNFIVAMYCHHLVLIAVLRFHVEVQNVDRQNFEWQNVKGQNVEWQNVEWQNVEWQNVKK